MKPLNQKEAEVSVADTATARTPRLRADASRNRERIVAAAREAFVEHGVDVPLDEVARRAGIGNATLYRHFGDRRDLVHHVVLSVMARVADAAEEALAQETDAFEALGHFVFAAADERVGALCSMLTEVFDRSDPAVLETRDRLDRALRELMDRARNAGRLRPDVAVGDLMIALTQLTRPLPGTACPDIDHFVRRHLQLFLDGLQAPARSVLPGSATTLDDLQRNACALREHTT